jgi:signal transduction histidine kinase
VSFRDSRGGRVLLTGVGCGALTLVAGTPYWYEHLVAALVSFLACLSCGSAGALLATGGGAWRRTGLLLIASAACWPASWLVAWNVGAGPILAFYGQGLFFILAGTAILSYPTGRLTGAGEWAWLGYAVAVLFGGEFWVELASRPEWSGLASDVVWPRVGLASPTSFQLATDVVGAGQVVLALWYAALLWLRSRRLTGLDRPAVVPVLISAALVGGVSAVLSSQHSFWTSLSGLESSYFAQGTMALLVPSAVLFGALRERWRELSAPHRVVRMTSSRTSVASVRAALAAGLRDPSLVLLFWVADENGYVDQHGASHPPDEPGPDGRWRIEVQTEDAQPLAIVEVDEVFRQRPDLVEAVLRAGAQALLTAQLQAAASLHLDQILAAQDRLEEKAQAERSRLERDLHEGAQRRLNALAAQLETLIQTTPDRAARAVAVACHSEALATITDLQGLASGLQPLVLRSNGLGPALTEVAGRLGLAVELAVSDVRHPPAVEATAYFAFCEALTNVAKHAPEAAVRIEVTAADGWLHGLVADDGPGGARSVPGGGLAGIEDRARALHGWALPCG